MCTEIALRNLLKTIPVVQEISLATGLDHKDLLTTGLFLNNKNVPTFSYANLRLQLLKEIEKATDLSVLSV